MVDFAECIADDLPPIGDEAFCNGFSGCGNPAGMRPSAENLNAVLYKIATESNNANLSFNLVGTTLQLLSNGEIVSTVVLPEGGGGGGGFFPGFIAPFFGAVLAIPAGWALCDGNNGTPNLVNRTVIGAGDLYGVGSMGGSVQHDHGGTTGDTVLDAGMIPAHRHLIAHPGTFNGVGATPFNSHFVASNSGGDQEYSLDFAGGEPSVSRTGLPVDASSNPVGGGGAPHDHTIAMNSHLPPYTALLWIMKL